MQKIWKTLLSLAMSLVAFLAKALGGWDAALSVMFLMMALDVTSGLLVALARKSGKTEGGGFRSNSLFVGLTRKMLMVLLVILGTALDSLLGTSICRLSVIGFYAASEAFSVVENATLLGVPFPRGLLASLEAFQGQKDGAGGPGDR